MGKDTDDVVSDGDARCGRSAERSPGCDAADFPRVACEGAASLGALPTGVGRFDDRPGNHLNFNGGTPTTDIDPALICFCVTRKQNGTATLVT